MFDFSKSLIHWKPHSISAAFQTYVPTQKCVTLGSQPFLAGSRLLKAALRECNILME